MRTSIRQVAERARVSPMTVSRVLRGRHDVVQEATRQRVLDAVHELNYVPVRSAAQNKHVETFAIGLVPYYINVARNQIDSLTYEGICQEAHQQGYDLLVMLRNEADWMVNRQEVRFLDRRSDGFIFISPGVGEWSEALEAIVQHEIPAVVCYRRDVPEGVAWVDPDNEAIVRLAVNCLLQQGHRHIAYMAGPAPQGNDQPRLALPTAQRNYDDGERSRIFRQIAAQHTSDSTFHTMQHVKPDWQLQATALQEIRQRGITGVVCVNDLLAMQLWQMAQEAGLRVPQDLSIVGVDDAPMAAGRGLTTVAFGYDAVGRAAVQTWLQLRAGAETSECCTIVPVQLVERATVDKPRAT